MDENNWDYSLSDVPMLDPFLSLSLPFQPDLRDISDLIRQQQLECGEPSPILQQGEYEDSERMEINSLVNALAKDTNQFMSPQHNIQHTPVQQVAPLPCFEFSPVAPLHVKTGMMNDVVIESVVKREIVNEQIGSAKPNITTEDCVKIEAVRTLASLGPEEVNRLVALASSSKEGVAPKQRPIPKVGIATKVQHESASCSQNQTSNRLNVQSSQNSHSSSVSPSNNFPERSEHGIYEDSADDGSDEDTTPSVHFTSRKSKNNMKNPCKVERRSAHNLIEKKYRCSINDKIGDLKDMLVANDSKISKSAVLKKAVDYIWYLRSQNENLRRQNNELKQVLASKGEPIPSSPSSPGASSDSSGPVRSMPDKSRVTLFVFMMAIMVVNPLSIILDPARPGASIRAHGPSRTLLSASFEDSEGDNWWHERLFRLMCMWLLNGMIIACVLARIFIYGEPVTSTESTSWTDLTRLKLKASRAAHNGDYVSATSCLNDCLANMGRPAAIGTLDQWASFIWQIFRQVLHRLWIGEYLSRQRRGGLKSHSVMQSHAQAAVIYKQLLEIGLMDAHTTILSGLTTALSAVNLAEASGISLTAQNRVEIYVLARMQVQKCLGSRLKLVQLYLMRRAEKIVKKSEQPLPNYLSWIFSKTGCDFVSNHGIPRHEVYSPTSLYPFCTTSNENVYLSALTCDFKQYLLESVCDAQLYSHKHNPSNVWTKTVNGQSINSLMDKCELLLECSKGDQICTWWTNLLTCAVCWAAGNRDAAAQRYGVVRVIPPALLKDEHALALGHAFCARRMCLDRCASKSMASEKYREMLWFHCSNSRKALAKLVIESCANTRIATCVRLLAYDWLHRCCIDIWWGCIPHDDSYWLHPAASHLQYLFSNCVMEYRTLLIHEKTNNESKLLLLESMCRMLNGSNPVHTSQFLRRCSTRSGSDISLTDIDLKYLNQLLRMHSALPCF